MRFSNVGKCCCALFIGLLTWSRGTSIEEFSATASVSTRLEIVYIQGCLFELAVLRSAMTGSPGPSAAAAPVTLNLARYPAADHVTAGDRSPEPRISGAIYTRQRLLQLRSLATARQSDIFLTRINRLGIAKDTSRRPRHRGVRGGRKSTPRQGCARLMNQRQHDSSYRPLAMNSSPQLPSGTNYTTSTIVPRGNRTHYRQNRTTAYQRHSRSWQAASRAPSSPLWRC